MAVSSRVLALRVQRLAARIPISRRIDFIGPGQDLPGQIQALRRVRQRDVRTLIERIQDALPQITSRPSTLPWPAQVPERQLHPTVRDRDVHHRGKLPVPDQEALLGTRWTPVRLLAQVDGVVLGKLLQKGLRPTSVTLKRDQHL